MVSEIQNSELVDPLHGHSGLSLFPRTIRASTDASNPSDPDDLQSIHDFMKSMGLRSPHKLLEKAKAVISGGSEVLNSSFVAVMDNNDTFAAKGKENPQERRPGLGRKRARFSLKPDTSKPIVSLEASLEIDHLQNPEEFFSAYEKLENARKEIQRQTGGNTTYLNEYNSSTNVRRRRPGMLGKSVSYKHRYSSVLSENNSTFTSCQDILEQEVLCPPNPDLREETTDMDVETQEIELAGSIAKTESRVNELLHELFSSNNEDLEGNRALSLLQERLQIKPLDLGKLCLPDFPDTGKTDFAAFQEKLPRRHNSLSEVHNLVKGIQEKTPAKHKEVAKSSMHSLESPTPPRSPFASIFLLKKQISQLNPLRDPFSPLNVDLSTTRYHSSVEHIEKQSEQIVIQEKSSTSSKLKSLEGDETTKTMVANTGLQKVITGGSVHLPDESLNDTSSRQRGGIIFCPIGSHGDLEDRDGCQHMDDWTMDTTASRPNTDTDVLLNGPNDMEENIEDVVQQAVSTVQQPMIDEGSTMSDTNARAYGFIEMEDNVEDILQTAASSAQPDVILEDSAVENLNSSQSQFDKSTPVAVGDHDMNVSSTTSEVGQEEYIEKYPGTLLNKQNKAKRQHEPRQKKAFSRRQSLADAGTSLEGGVRRSKRIKMRPLAYWKGERFLYGRVHNSLTTVIGVKYESPAKGDGKPTLKVKSYVSDAYKELVELVARH